MPPVPPIPMLCISYWSPEPEGQRMGTESLRAGLLLGEGVTLRAAQLQAGQNILLQVLAMDLGGTDGGKCPNGDRGS